MGHDNNVKTPQVPLKTSLRCNELIEKFGDVKSMLVTLNPSMQVELYEDKEKCFFGDYPTLSELNATYTKKTAQAWLVPQLTDLAMYCGAKEKLSKLQLQECAEIIAHDYFYMKVSEMMLFFAQFKRGRYGRFFGAVDPLIVVTALKTFSMERNYAYEENEKRLAEERFQESMRNSCSWEDYLRRTGQVNRLSPIQRFACKKEKRIKEAESDTILNIASQMVSNSYGCDAETLNALKRAFRQKYRLSPEDYINRHMNKS
jgi:hypothetical protein